MLILPKNEIFQRFEGLAHPGLPKSQLVEVTIVIVPGIQSISAVLTF